MKFILIFAIILEASCTTIVPVQTANCEPTNKSASNRDIGACLARLQTFPEQYEMCRDHSNFTCYIFLRQGPFFILNNPSHFKETSDALYLQRPFKCGSFAHQFRHVGGIEGITPAIHAITSSAEEYCMWAGHTNKCAFNQLVGFIDAMAEKGYRFAISNGLIDLPSRRCFSEPGAPLVSEATKIFGSVSSNPSSFEQVLQLLRPFHMGTWLLLGLSLGVLAILRLAIGVKYHCFRGAGICPTLKMAFSSEEAFNFVQKLNDSERKDLELVMKMFRASMVAMFAIVALFYEVAVVNFLFQQSNSTINNMRRFSEDQHAQFAVPAATALEQIWEYEVVQRWKRQIAPGRKPWAECASTEECFEWLSSGKVKYVVSFETRGKYLLSRESDCGAFSMFESNRRLYTFNTVWYYNERCNRARKRQMDREILSLRMDGTINSIFDEYSADSRCDKKDEPHIRPVTILIPMVIFMLPLLLGIMVVLCKRRKKSPDKIEQANVVMKAVED